MRQIAAIIPTYHRADRLEKFINNFYQTSSEATLYFVINSKDQVTLEELDRLKFYNFFVCDEEYVGCSNYGFANTKEPFVLFAADDVEFKKDWDTSLLEVMKDKSINIAGGSDSWPISKSGVHISHPLIRRSSIEGVPYYSGYKHYMCDIEFIQRGLKAGVVKILPETLIEHLHPEVGTAPEDDTYIHSRKNIKRDWKVYESRSAEFEIWDVLAMYKGYAVPTPLNPKYEEPLISIVLPVYNAKEHLERTLLSIFSTTYYNFELIIIDDCSNQETVDFINSLEIDPAFKKCRELVKIMNKEHRWVNYNWNEGVDLAKGNYIAVLNSDIVLSKFWDKDLVFGLIDSTVTCPYEHNAYRKRLHKLDPFIQKYCPNMIKGACFMFKAEDRFSLFPIPKELKHWCGDNWIADRAEELQGVKFMHNSTIWHAISASGMTVSRSLYLKTIKEDVEAYERLSGRDMTWLKKKVFSQSATHS